MPRALIFSICLLLVGLPLHAASTGWVALSSHKQLDIYLSQALAGKYYPTSLDCRAHLGQFQFKFSLAPVGPNKPYYKWNATYAGPGESIDAVVAKLPVKGHEHLKYRIVQKCIVGGYTFVVAFRGTGTKP